MGVCVQVTHLFIDFKGSYATHQWSDVCTYCNIDVHTYTYTHNTHTHIHMYTHNTYTHIHIYTYTHIHTHIHTYTHTYIHTYIHTHIYIRSLRFPSPMIHHQSLRKGVLLVTSCNRYVTLMFCSHRHTSILISSASFTLLSHTVSLVHS